MSNIELTYSDYINRRYTDFYNKHGYIPIMFNAYNCFEVKNIAPTISTAANRNGGGIGQVLIIEKDGKLCEMS